MRGTFWRCKRQLAYELGVGVMESEVLRMILKSLALVNFCMEMLFGEVGEAE